MRQQRLCDQYGTGGAIGQSDALNSQRGIGQAATAGELVDGSILSCPRLAGWASVRENRDALVPCIVADASDRGQTLMPDACALLSCEPASP